jgi:hypothetical protein
MENYLNSNWFATLIVEKKHAVNEEIHFRSTNGSLIVSNITKRLEHH